MASGLGCVIPQSRLASPRCGGRVRSVALIEEAAVIDRILRHLGLPTSIVTPRQARAPLLADVPDGSGWPGLIECVKAMKRQDVTGTMRLARPLLSK